MMTSPAAPLATFPAYAADTLAALAFDYGTQRIGVAYGQNLSGTAQGIKILRARDGIPDWQEIQSLINEWQPNVFVVGLPYHMDGTESPLLVRAVKFANRLNGRFNLPSYGIDERLSSIEAREAEGSYGGREAPAIDDIAARIILENWFAELRRRR